MGVQCTMKKLQIALLDHDGYMEAFSCYLNSKKYMIENRLFTNVGKLKEYLEQNRVDVLLVGQEMDFKQVIPEEKAGRILLLSDTEKEGGCPAIFKYQSAEKILREILSLLAEEKGALQISLRESGRSVEFIGVYSPYGISGDPMEQMGGLGEDKQRVLYMNLELFDGIRDLVQEKSSQIRGMSELVFYLKQRREKAALKLQSLVQRRYRMDYIYPVEDYRDLYSLEREDVDLLLTILAEETPYHAVIFDVGFVSEAALYLLYRCDRLYLPRARDQWEQNKQSSWKELMAREGLEGALQQIVYIN